MLDENSIQKYAKHFSKSTRVLRTVSGWHRGYRIRVYRRADKQSDYEIEKLGLISGPFPSSYAALKDARRYIDTYLYTLEAV